MVEGLTYIHQGGKRMNEHVMFTGDGKGGLKIYKEPTYVSDGYYSGINLITRQVEHIHENDAYFFEGSIIDFFTDVKRRGKDLGELILRDAISFNEIKLYVFDEYCTLKDRDGNVHSIKFMFDRGLKVTSDVEMIYSKDMNAYRVTTPYSRCRQNKYAMRVPQGESYTRIINLLKKGGLTTQEMAVMLDDNENHISGRLSELYACNVVTKVGKRKMLDTNKWNTVWELV